MLGRRNVAALVAEFLGTGVLTLLIFSVQRSTIGVPFFVALAAGLAVMIMAFAVGRTSGGYFNPALVIGMWSARKLNTARALAYIVVQFLGAWAAYGLYKYLTKNNSLPEVGGQFAGRIMVAEAVGTGIFAFAVAGAIYQRFTAIMASTVAGLGLTLGIIAASPASLGLLNPAVAFGVRAWVLGTYVLGPILGAIIGVNLYGLLFAEPKALAAADAPAAPLGGAAAAVSAPAANKTAAKRSTAKKSAAKKTTKRSKK